MIYIFTILIVTTLLAYYAERKSVVVLPDRFGVPRLYEKRRISRYAFFSILAILVLFVGLRTSYNDTYAYQVAFNQLDTGLDAFQEMGWVLADNPGFYISNVLIKTYVSENSQVMLFLYALSTIVLFLLFYRRWSDTFWLTVYLFTATGMLLLSMAAVKQVLAMGIGLYGITCFLTNRRIGFVICVLIGSTIHPYLLLYLSAFLLCGRVWSRKIFMILIATLLSGIFIEQFVQIARDATELIGASYAENTLLGQGVNFFRFGVYTVTPVLTWKFRRRINASGSNMLILCLNFTLVGWCFMFVALFANPNVFGRMAAYFSPFMHLALPSLLIRYAPRKNRLLILSGCVAGYFIYLVFELYARGFTYHWAFI